MPSNDESELAHSLPAAGLSVQERHGQPRKTRWTFNDGTGLFVTLEQDHPPPRAERQYLALQAIARGAAASKAGFSASV